MSEFKNGFDTLNVIYSWQHKIIDSNICQVWEKLQGYSPWSDAWMWKISTRKITENQIQHPKHLN